MDWIDSPFELPDHFDGYIFDIFGVLHNGKSANPHTLSWLKTLKEMGKLVALISNSPLSGNQVATGLEGYGIDKHLYGHLLTAGMEARSFLETYPKGTLISFVGSPEMAASLIPPYLTPVDDISQAHLLVFAGPAPHVTEPDFYDDLLKSAIDHGIPMVCANPDMGVYVGEGYALRAGFFAQRYETMGGHVSYHGKPHPSIYMRLLSLWPPIKRERILCVGDSLVTDVVGATCQNHKSLLIAGHMCEAELGLDIGILKDKQHIREKISTHLAKGPYNPTYGLLLT